MKRSLFRMLFAVVISSLFLYGCSNEETIIETSELKPERIETVEEPEEIELNLDADLEDNEIELELEQVIEEPTEDTFNSVYEKDVSIIQSDLQIGLSKEEITQLLGDQYAEFVSPLDDIVMWKYDLLTSSDYIFDAEAPSDAIDFEGFFSGNIGAQLFVEWSMDFTNHYVMYYICGEEGEICEYRLWDDGTTDETVIN